MRRRRKTVLQVSSSVAVVNQIEELEFARTNTVAGWSPEVGVAENPNSHPVRGVGLEFTFNC